MNTDNLKKKRSPRKGVEITPYKGGRTAMIHGQRCTPEVAQKLNQISERTGETKADILERLILEEWQQVHKPGVNLA